MRRAFIALEFLIGFLVLCTVVLARSWWSLLLLPGIGLMVILHLYIVDGFILDRHGSAVTGRDADRYAQYRAKLTLQQRADLDDALEQLRFDNGDR